MTAPPMPEHDKLSAAKAQDATQTVGEFIDWLGEQGIFLMTSAMDEESHRERWVPVEASHRLMARFFGIDEHRLEEEKRALLAAVRS